MSYIKIDDGFILENKDIYLSTCRPAQNEYTLTVGNGVICKNFHFLTEDEMKASADYFEKILIPHATNAYIICSECECDLTPDEIKKNNTQGIARNNRLCDCCETLADPT